MTHSPYIIGIAGPAGSGKSTLARRLAIALAADGYTTAVHSFAAPIKRTVNAWLRSMPLAHVVIADDVRFANEAAAIRDRWGFVAHLQGILSTSSHASERGVEFRSGDFKIGLNYEYNFDILRACIIGDLNERNLHGSFRDAIDALRDDYLANRLEGETAVEYNERTGKNAGYLRR